MARLHEYQGQRPVNHFEIVLPRGNVAYTQGNARQVIEEPGDRRVLLQVTCRRSLCVMG